MHKALINMFLLSTHIAHLQQEDFYEFLSYNQNLTKNIFDINLLKLTF